MTVALSSVIVIAEDETAKIDAVESHSNSIYYISTTEEFANFLSLVSSGKTFSGDTIYLTKDIASPLLPYSNRLFEGVLNANHHKISNLNQPLFTRNNGTILNVTLYSGVISGDNDVSGICTYNYGNIIGCVNYVDINARSENYMHVAGISSYNYGNIIDCSNYGNITCSMSNWSKNVSRCGGITSYSQGKDVVNCTNHGTIRTNGVYSSLTGGIVGDLQGGRIIGCKNNGAVVSILRSATIAENDPQSYRLQYTGGIVGQSQVGSIIDGCRNYGAISSNYQYVGGISGAVSRTSMYNLVNFGKVESIDGYGYACASGITGYSHGVDVRSDFYNCINHGAISAMAHYDIASAAGLSVDLNKCNIANCYSDGSVSAQRVGGTATQAFKIPLYECEDCNIINNVSSITDANDYIASIDNERDLLLWANINNRIDLIDKLYSYPMPLCGACMIFLFNYDAEIGYNITLQNIENRELDLAGVNVGVISKLAPETEYDYRITAEGQVVGKGNFITLKPEFRTTIDDISYESFCLHSVCLAAGVQCRNLTAYVFYKGELCQNQIINDSIFVVGGLDEDCTYKIELEYDLNGKKYHPFSQSVKTKSITPKFNLLNSTTYSLVLQCENYKELAKYSPSLFLEQPYYYAYGDKKEGNDSTVILDENGVVSISGLMYDYTPKLYGQYIFKDTVRKKPIESFSTNNWGGEGVIQVSKKSAMIHGLFGGMGSRVTNGGFNDRYDRARFYYRDATASDAVSEYYKDGVCIDDNVDYAVTIPLNSAFYQFYISLQRSNYVDPKNNSINGEWFLIDARIPTVNIVEPRFFAVRYSNQNLSFSFVDGEEETIQVGLLYKMELADRFNEIVLSDKAGSYKYSRYFSSLVPQLRYVFRFYSKTSNGKIYYSHFYLLEGGVISEFDDYSIDKSYDLNGDNAIDIGDVNIILSGILIKATDSFMDINNDNKVDVGDVNAILQYILDK